MTGASMGVACAVAAVATAPTLAAKSSGSALRGSDASARATSMRSTSTPTATATSRRHARRVRSIGSKSGRASTTAGEWAARVAEHHWCVDASRGAHSGRQFSSVCFLGLLPCKLKALGVKLDEDGVGLDLGDERFHLFSLSPRGRVSRTDDRYFAIALLHHADAGCQCCHSEAGCEDYDLAHTARCTSFTGVPVLVLKVPRSLAALSPAARAVHTSRCLGAALCTGGG